MVRQNRRKIQKGIDENAADESGDESVQQQTARFKRVGASHDGRFDPSR